MKCDQSQARMIDVLYGEEMSAHLCYEFFQHLEGCAECKREYREMLETRDLLGEWGQESGQSPDLKLEWPSRSFRDALWGVRWWPATQRLAAGILIAFGVIAILQSMGLLGGEKVMVSEPALTEMVHDMILAEQAMERQLTLRALLEVKEDIELDQVRRSQQLQHYLVGLEQRYVENLEESTHYLKTLLSR